MTAAWSLAALLSLSVLLAPPAQGPPPAARLLPEPPPGQVWEAVPELSDEFEGASLDPKKWMPRHPSWKGREPSRFDPANVTVEGGLLLLRSTSAVRSLDGVRDPQKDVWVRSACVASLRPSAGPGYYEVRLKASRLSMTSSFWFQGKHSEIDVVEEIGAPAREPGRARFMLMNTHYFAEGWEKDRATPVQWPMPTGAADGFHTYGAWWKDAGTVWFYHDGEKVGEARTAGPFSEPQHLFLDTEVFVWEGLPSVESLDDPERNAMAVDWVRAWKLITR